jgi:hypothetical protein
MVGISPPSHLPSVRPPEYVLGLVETCSLTATGCRHKRRCSKARARQWIAVVAITRLSTLCEYQPGDHVTTHDLHSTVTSMQCTVTLIPVLPLHTMAPESMVGAGVVGPTFSGLESSYLTLLHMVSRTLPSFLLCCPRNRKGMPTSFSVPLFSPSGTWHSCQPLPDLPGHKWLYSTTDQSPHSLSFML